MGKLEELDFAEEVRTWAGIVVSEKLPRNGDFILAFRDPSGAPVEPCILVDKDKASISEGDIRKLIRDAKERRRKNQCLRPAVQNWLDWKQGARIQGASFHEAI